jgi:hypothetical protein
MDSAGGNEGGGGVGGGVVQQHTYARLRFDNAAEQAVQHLSNVLMWHRGSPYEGQFVSQMEARAGEVACKSPHLLNRETYDVAERQVAVGGIERFSFGPSAHVMLGRSHTAARRRSSTLRPIYTRTPHPTAPAHENAPVTARTPLSLSQAWGARPRTSRCFRGCRGRA